MTLGIVNVMENRPCLGMKILKSIALSMVREYNKSINVLSKEVLILQDHKIVKSQWNSISSTARKISEGLRSTSLL